MRAKYLGLDLPSPIIVSSSPYTSNVKSVEQCAASGAGAVVLKSIFEEQILHHAAALDTVSDSAYGDAEVYLQRYLGEDYKAGFLRLVQEARSKTELPVIASINCVVDKGDWIEYATAMADAGASALGLIFSSIYGHSCPGSRTGVELCGDRRSGGRCGEDSRFGETAHAPDQCLRLVERFARSRGQGVVFSTVSSGRTWMSSG